MKKVLIITYYWPPQGGVGVQRWLKLSKYLLKYDYEPIIYTQSQGISSLEDPVALKILSNCLDESPFSAKVFNEFILIVLENMPYIILISSAALAFETLNINWELIKIKNILIIKNLFSFILDICTSSNLYKSNYSFFG